MSSVPDSYPINRQAAPCSVELGRSLVQCEFNVRKRLGNRRAQLPCQGCEQTICNATIRSIPQEKERRRQLAILVAFSDNG